MNTPWAFAGSQVLAVALAVLAAVAFGLAAVRQHQVVQELVPGGRRSRPQLADLARLTRDPAWLVGAVQGVVGGGLHIVALALAPIAVVQPIGVLAVPVTVAATAWRRRRRPPGAHVVGAVVSIVSIAVLTLLLLVPSGVTSSTPSTVRLMGATVAALTVAATLILIARSRNALARCACLAVSAAVLFGLTSTLMRLATRVIADGLAAADPRLLTAVAVSVIAIVPLGVWALQTAYAAGSSQVVICCTTLIDPLVAVAGGAWLLRERFTLDPLALVTIACCAGLTAVGVVLLSAHQGDDVPSTPVNATPATLRSTCSAATSESEKGARP